uniref:Uncharacterized protein n=1 Tax=Solanum tuberosum TaxID=4113 RepID=M1B7I6_SOLTU
MSEFTTNSYLLLAFRESRKGLNSFSSESAGYKIEGHVPQKLTNRNQSRYGSIYTRCIRKMRKGIKSPTLLF